MDNYLIWIVGLALLFAVYWFDPFSLFKKQAYANVSDMSGSGSFDNMAPPLNPNEISDALSFAELVDESSSGVYRKLNETGSAMKDLDDTFNSMALPRSARNITPHNIDVADPKSFSYMASMPRVTIKPRTYEDADPYRGDIPIRSNPNIALVTKSVYDTDSQKTDAFFSDSTLASSEKLRVNSYKNTPMAVSLGGVIGDYTS